MPRTLMPDDVQVELRLGGGAFGEVWLATLRESRVPTRKIGLKVAKQIDQAELLLQEALLMAQIPTHRNVVELVGTVKYKGVACIALGYYPQGTLHDLTNRWNRLTDGGDAERVRSGVRATVCRDVSVGMAHLHAHRVVHRDLSARNVLVDFRGNKWAFRVADFGLSRLLELKLDKKPDAGDRDYYYRSGSGIFAARWTAPEAIAESKFTEASDVWSFAITVIETFLDPGQMPYGTSGNDAVIRSILDGQRPKRPSLCPAKFYSTLMRCWAAAPESRPRFAKLAQDFTNLKAADVCTCNPPGENSVQAVGGNQRSVSKKVKSIESFHEARCLKCGAKKSFCTCVHANMESETHL